MMQIFRSGRWALLLAMALLVGALLAFPAMAASDVIADEATSHNGVPVFGSTTAYGGAAQPVKDGGKFWVELSDDSAIVADAPSTLGIEADKHYMLWIYAGVLDSVTDFEFDDTNLYYIDQQTAATVAGNAVIVFDGRTSGAFDSENSPGFLPMRIPECTLILTGTGTPAIVGYINNQTELAEVSVKLTMTATNTQNALVCWYANDDLTEDPVMAAYNGTTGAYEADLEVLDDGGTYTLVVWKASFLRYTLTGVPVAAEFEPIEIDYTGSAGELDNATGAIQATDIILSGDLQAVLDNFNLVPGNPAITNVRANIDENGIILSSDLQFVLNNFNTDITKNTFTWAQFSAS